MKTETTAAEALHNSLLKKGFKFVQQIGPKYVYLRPDGKTKKVFTINEEVDKADQSFKKECDVNEIIRKFTKTGQVTHLRGTQGVYADVSQVPDLHTAMITVTQAQQAFDALPSDIRKRFANSPTEMIEFLKDPKNEREAIKLGLLELKPRTGSNLPAGTKPKGAVVPPKNDAKKAAPKAEPKADNNDD